MIMKNNKLNLNLQFFAWADIENDAPKTSDIEYTKIAPGAMITIRVLDAEPFSRYTHWLPLQKRSLTCGGSTCPICEVIKSQRANKETPTYSKARRHILHVYNYETKRIEFFEQGNEVYKDLSAFHRMLGDIRNADLKVMKTGAGKDTKYTFMPQPPTPLDSAIQAEYEQKRVDFAERFKAPQPEDVRALMSGKTFDEVYNQQNVQKEEDEVSFVIAE